MKQLFLLWKNLSRFNGRSDRKEYWSFFFFYFFITVLIYTQIFRLYSIDKTFFYFVLVSVSIPFLFIIGIPWFAVTLRRLHDIGKKGWEITIPILSLIIFNAMVIFTYHLHKISRFDYIYNFCIFLSGVMLTSFIVFMIFMARKSIKLFQNAQNSSKETPGKYFIKLSKNLPENNPNLDFENLQNNTEKKSFCQECSIYLPEEYSNCPKCGKPVIQIRTEAQNEDNKELTDAENVSKFKTYYLQLIYLFTVSLFFCSILVLISTNITEIRPEATFARILGESIILFIAPALILAFFKQNGKIISWITLFFTAFLSFLPTISKDINLTNNVKKTNTTNKLVINTEKNIKQNSEKKNTLSIQSNVSSLPPKEAYEAGYDLIYKNKRTENNIEKGLKLIKEAASQSYPEAQYSLGNIYFEGKIVKKDYAIAFRWYLKAAENENQPAQYKVASMYKDGVGVEKDYNSAYTWFIKSVRNNNNLDAFLQLAEMCYSGLGTTKNITSAFIWIDKALASNLKDSDTFLDNILNELTIKELNDLANKYNTGDYFKKDSERAFILYLKAAYKGNSFAQYKVSDMYYNGTGTEKNLQEAFKWCSKAAENNFNEAQFKLGFYYLNGVGTDKNIEQAVFCFTKSAEQQNPEAQLQLGLIFFNEKDKEDIYKSLYWISRSILNKNKNAEEFYSNNLPFFESKISSSDACKIGDLYYKHKLLNGMINNAVYWYKISSRKGNLKAQYQLGLIFSKGSGIKKNPSEAVKWIRESAEQGYPESQLLFSKFYEKGFGVEKSDYNSILWLSKTVISNNSKALSYYGKNVKNLVNKVNSQEALSIAKLFLNEGRISLKEKSIIWLKKSSDEGNPEAKYILADIYENGILAEKSINSAFQLYKQSANEGNSLSQYKLGNYYENGEAVNKNYLEALNWYLKSAEKNNPEAQYKAGIFYLNGKGTEVNTDKALYWLNKSANNNCSDALNELSKIYFYGNENQSKDIDKAITYINQAIALGNKNSFKILEDFGKENDKALLNLANIYYEGKITEKNYKKAINIFEQLSSKNNNQAQFLLAQMYYSGIGIEKDEKKSFQLFLKSALLGNVDSQSRIALFYYDGIFIKKSLIKAYAWLKIASENGSSSSEQLLSILKYKMKKNQIDLDKGEEYYYELKRSIK